jgi:hypothetical protein
VELSTKEKDMNTTVSNQVQDLINSLNDAIHDAEKHDNGVKAAGTRLRTTLLGLTKEAKVIRAAILENQKTN